MRIRYERYVGMQDSCPDASALAVGESSLPFPTRSAQSVMSSERQELERAARALPDSELRSAILATLADRLPTPREALAWIAALQTQHRRT